MKNVIDDSVFLKVVKKSSLAFKIKKIAPECFSIYTDYVTLPLLLYYLFMVQKMK